MHRGIGVNETVLLPHHASQLSPLSLGPGWGLDRGSGREIFVQVRRSGPRIESEIPSLGPDRRKAARGWPVFGTLAIRLPVLDKKIRPDT